MNIGRAEFVLDLPVSISQGRLWKQKPRILKTREKCLCVKSTSLLSLGN